MDKTPEFDEFADGYTKHIDDVISFAGKGQDFFTRVKCDQIIRMLKENFGDTNNLRVLDVGCGSGITDQILQKDLPGLEGADISPKMVEEAKALNPNLNYKTYDGSTLPYEDNTFDFVFAVCVMHHVPPKQWQDFLNEMKRVTKKGGMVAIFEHNPLNPLTMHVVNNCEYDNDATLLRCKKTKQLFNGAGFENIHRKYILFFPFESSLLGKVENQLGWLPLGAQYYVAAHK